MSLILLLIGSSVLLCMETSHQYLTDLKLLEVRLMDKILHDPKDPKLWELWYIPYYGSCRILSIHRMDSSAWTMQSFAHQCPYYDPKGPCTQIVCTWAQCTYVRPKYILFGTCASYALMSRASREA